MFPHPVIKLPWYARPFLWAIMGIDWAVTKLTSKKEEEEGPKGG